MAYYARLEILLKWKVTPPTVHTWRVVFNRVLILYKLTYSSQSCTKNLINYGQTGMMWGTCNFLLSWCTAHSFCRGCAKTHVRDMSRSIHCIHSTMSFYGSRSTIPTFFFSPLPHSFPLICRLLIRQSINVKSMSFHIYYCMYLCFNVWK